MTFDASLQPKMTRGVFTVDVVCHCGRRLWLVSVFVEGVNHMWLRSRFCAQNYCLPVSHVDTEDAAVARVCQVWCRPGAGFQFFVIKRRRGHLRCLYPNGRMEICALGYRNPVTGSLLVGAISHIVSHRLFWSLSLLALRQVSPKCRSACLT